MSDDQTEPENIVSPDVSQPVSERRDQRIQEYLEQSLQELNPLVAVLGAVNTDLLLVEKKLGEAVNNALGGLALTLEEVAVVTPSLGHMFKVTKQIERYADLQTRLKSADQAAAQMVSQTQPSRQTNGADVA